MKVVDMLVGVLGINHKIAPMVLREALARGCRRRFGGRVVHAGHAFVLLSTCNRTEVYFSSDDVSLSHSYVLQQLRSDVEEEFEQRVYSFFGVDCFTHLARVTAGLDSAIVAETEIQGQVSAAYQQAAMHSTLTKELHYIFQKALQIAKQARHRYLQGCKIPSIEQALWSSCCEAFHHPQKLSFFCLGASQTNQKMIAHLKNKECHHVHLCNRTEATGQAMAEKLGVMAVPWERRYKWHSYDVVITATTSPEYLLPFQGPSVPHAKLAFDLSVPRNIDPKIGELVTLLDIDLLQQRAQQQQGGWQKTLEAAESHILECVDRSMVGWHRRTHYAELHGQKEALCI